MNTVATVEASGFANRVVEAFLHRPNRRDAVKTAPQS